MNNFSGRVAVITGAAKGIGRAMAQQFARRGAKVALLDVDTEAAARAAQAIQQQGGDALPLFADVSDPTTLSHAAAEVQKAYGRTDILCCNAGIYPQAFLETMTESLLLRADAEEFRQRRDADFGHAQHVLRVERLVDGLDGFAVVGAGVGVFDARELLGELLAQLA
jgi:NAD(P)-dependent dehydrogenase (short-subunit alcohol dehydrogenase family)